MQSGISGWSVYWLLQLDAIRTFFEVFTVFGGFGFIIAVAALVTAPTEGHRDIVKPFVVLGTILLPVILAGVVLIPTTKTMAAILIVPRLATAENLQTVSKDTGDLYKLAMQRLKDALGEETAK